MLTSYDLDRFSRQIKLQFIGKEGQQRIKKTRILVIGCGGLGSNVTQLLAQMGVGYIRIVDKDIVELSNLPRTPLYTTEVIGIPKVKAAEKRLTELYPQIEIDAHTTSINQETIDNLVTDDIDVVIDGLDNFSTRRIVNKCCFKLKIPYVFAGTVGSVANLVTYGYSSKESSCWECHFGEVPNDSLDSSATIGVHSCIVAITASIQVSEAIRIILGKTPSLNNQMLFIDLNSLSFDFIPLKPNPDCRICGRTKY